MSQKRPTERLAENNDVVDHEATTKPLKSHTAPRVKVKTKRSMKSKLTISFFVILTAVIVGLFGYQWWLDTGTGIVADKAQSQALDVLKGKIAESKNASTASSSVDANESKAESKPKKPVYSMDNLPVWETVPPGEDAYGAVYIPRFGTEDEWEKPLVQGYGTVGSTGEQKAYENAETQHLVDLLGVVHYGSTAQPGEFGNMAVSGHRMGYGNAFEHADKLVMGDEVRLTTTDGTYIYKVIQSAVKLLPTDTTFTDTNPLGSEKNTTRRLMTIITCEPANQWSELSSGRLAVVLELSDFVTE